MITRKLFRVRIQSLLRKIRLLSLADRARYHIKVWMLGKRNRKFKAENPGFALPPSYLAFDAYSSSHWEFYKVSGEQTASFLTTITCKYFSADNPLSSIYEWGCGPARITRHLPSVFKDTEIHASDYNAQTIEWCREQIAGVSFIKNELHPPLPYPGNKFDFVYAISVFTHLSEMNGLNWAAELYRVLKPGGILLITTDSDSVYQKEFLTHEKKKYDTSGIVIKDEYEEGKKMYLTRHSPRYIKEKLLQPFEILEHVPGVFPFMKQDYWVARKRTNPA
jgi:SAM-dependent methyltransferase